MFPEVNACASRRRRQPGRAAMGVVLIFVLIAGCSTVTGSPTAEDAGGASRTESPHRTETVVDGTAYAEAHAPSSRQLIDEALAAGEIDEEASWLYRTWLMFDDQLLPEQYRGAPDPHDTELLVHMPRLLPDLSQEIRQQIEPYFLRPTDSRSVFNADGNPPGLRSSSESALVAHPRTQLGATNTNDSASTDDRRCQDGWDTVVVPGVHLRVWACRDLDGKQLDGTAKLLSTVSGMLAAFAPRMVGDMGSLIPDQPASDPDPRSDDRIDIYLAPSRSIAPSREGREREVSETAYAISTPPYTAKTASGFVVMNQELLSDPGLAERALVHELFHVLQYTHNAFMPSRWFFEASAEWSSAYYVRHESRRLHQMRLPSLQNARPQLLQNPYGLVPYGAYLWPLFMEQEVGPGSIFAAWSALGALSGSGNDDAVIAVLGQQLSVADSFPEFVMRLYNARLPGDPIMTRFRNLDAQFPDGVAPQRPSLTLDDELLKIEYDTIFGTGFAFNPVEVVPPPEAEPDDEVFVTIMGDLSTQSGRQPSLEALVRQGDGTYERRPIAYSGDGTRVCVSQELILVLANQSPEGSDIAEGTIGLIRDDEPGCASIEVTHPQTGQRMADSGHQVTVNGIEDDDEPDSLPLVISVFDVPRESIDSYQVEVTLSGGTLMSPREMSWPLAEFESGSNDSFRMETVVDLDVDLTDANRPMTIEAVLLEASEETDRHEPTAQLHGEERDECLIGNWVISAAEMERFYNSVQNDADFAVQGYTGLTFSEDAYEYAPNLSVRMQIENDTFPISAVMSMGGSITGSYRADGFIITTSHEVANIRAAVKIGDRTYDGTDLVSGFLLTSPINSAPYECTDAGPVLMFATAGPDRMPIQLVPAD